jgi:hypothetical protein
MNDKFDELAKGLAQSVTRRGALKKFGAGLTGLMLASLGLTNNACTSSAQAANKSCLPAGTKCVLGSNHGCCGFCQPIGDSYGKHFGICI